MATYVTGDEVQIFTGCSDDDKALLADSAESIFNNLIDSKGLLSSTKTERYTEKDCLVIGRVFVLKTINPTAITTINGEAPGNFTLDGRKLTFEFSKNPQNAFPHGWTIVYVSGYASVPSDVKLATLHIAKQLHTAKSSGGISSFRQDLLSVTYDHTVLLTDTVLSPIIGKYKIANDRIF